MYRILVVEDDGLLLNDIADRLGDWGHEVLTAADGVAGLELIKGWHPDLVLCDINMPGKTGFDLVGAVKTAGEEFADMAFLLVSAMSTPGVVLKGLQSGADDFIPKPINYELLKAKIDAQLRKRQPRRAIAAARRRAAEVDVGVRADVRARVALVSWPLTATLAASLIVIVARMLLRSGWLQLG